MKTIYVLLNSAEKARHFVDDVSYVEGNATIRFGRNSIDAKSIMGVFTLDLSKKLKLEIENWKEEYDILFKKYLVL